MIDRKARLDLIERTYEREVAEGKGTLIARAHKLTATCKLMNEIEAERDATLWRQDSRP